MMRYEYVDCCWVKGRGRRGRFWQQKQDFGAPRNSLLFFMTLWPSSVYWVDFWSTCWTQSLSFQGAEMYTGRFTWSSNASSVYHCRRRINGKRMMWGCQPPAIMYSSTAQVEHRSSDSLLWDEMSNPPLCIKGWTPQRDGTQHSSPLLKIPVL